ncbi:MAG: N-6 DNA methylase [Paludibacteraceae bacterium]|nr:N-6 DNA methylase [Paludibacteraceae bacterium]
MAKSTHNIDLQDTGLIDAFYQRLLTAYGYSPEQLDRNVPIDNSAHADIAIWRTAEAKNRQSIPDICVIVICKEEHIRIDANNYLEAFKESSIGTVNFFVLHNLKETKVFLLDSSHPMGGVERIGDFPKAVDVQTDESIESFIRRMRRNTKEALLTAFDRCHNIVRNNDKLSPEAAFDEISKVMFIKMMYERKPDGELIFSQEKFLKDEKQYMANHAKEDYIAHLFEGVKVYFAEDDLYEKYDSVRICRKSFMAILKELEVIDFYDMTEDVKGVAFESLVGKTFRGELGQFFTPRQVVNYMIEVLDIKEGEAVCDPCCGSGGFLIRAFEYVQDAIDRDIQHQINKVKKSNFSASEKRNRIAKLLQECDKNIVGSRYGKLCKDYFFGVDANVRMARTAKMNMIMHGDGHVGVYLHDGLLDVKNVTKGRFDVVLINPPYGVHVDRTAKDENGNYVFGEYKVSQSAAELLFVERVINLLKPGGRAGLVLPEGLFTNANLKSFRKLIEGRVLILDITAMPPTVFLASGANVKPNLLFIRKLTEEEQKQHDLNYSMSVVKVSENELEAVAPLVREFMKGNRISESESIRVVDRGEMIDWAVAPLFAAQKVSFNSKYPTVRLSDLLTPSEEKIQIQDDVLYNRITVRLNGKGITLRDCVRGAEIGTKRQFVVHTGQLVVSKIDGKSGAMAIVPEEFDGAVVTPDFPVFNINTNRVHPDYLLLVICHPAVLQRIMSTTSGSTGRRRMSVPRFLAMQIALPSLSEQEVLMSGIRQLRQEQEELKRRMEENVESFYDNIIE